ncbi:hypothetical protein Pyn_33343 [Prunus yedoensis var. nudiflora]|uniref:Uncharacterized protein n=1 Tax=Prunus yedoensis var. nudiflora TaxID=2094558 RepID=A0A314YM51_PRUYE|nr:hypothetical protein Pyn_33343 [Prunus yedoensis var. nudiflora]
MRALSKLVNLNNPDLVLFVGEALVGNDVVDQLSKFNQIVIDSCCATFAEVQKRGKDFWAEFELYAVDLLVGIAC